VAAIGVNKAADQFVVLDEKTEREAASGRYKKQPGAVGSPGADELAGHAGRRPAVPQVVPSASPGSRPLPWSTTQQNLAVTYRDMGLTPDAIARKLGISRRLVTQMLLRHHPASRRPA
jgi:hypothetical protein